MADVGGTAGIAGDDDPPPGPGVVSAGTLLADRYRLDRQIGTGGMGRVRAAWDTVLCREVAVKLHYIDPSSGQAELKQFLQEARATAALQHAHVVTVYDSGTDGDQTYLVMELLPGPSLEAYIAERRPLPEAEAVSLAVQIASGIAAAHGAGVLHRDIKPSNIMFDANGRLKIIDFGIARVTNTTATAVAGVNTMAGSPPYLSPEQFQGRPADERSDLYAFGCLLTTLLTGQPPFSGEHPLAFGHQHVYSPPPLISDRCPGVAPELDRLVTQLLKKDPQDRPRSAQQVLEQLTSLEQAAAAGAEEASDAETAATALPAATEVLAATSAPSGPEPRARRHSRAVSWAVAAALAPVLIAAILTAGTTPAAAPESRAAAGSFQRVQRHGMSSHSSHAPRPERTNTGDQTIGTAGPDQNRPRRDTAPNSSSPSRPGDRRTQGNGTKPNAAHPRTTPTATPKPTATATASPKPTSSPTSDPTASAPSTSTPKPTSSPTSDPTATAPTASAPATDAPATKAPGTRSQ